MSRQSARFPFPRDRDGFARVTRITRARVIRNYDRKPRDNGKFLSRKLLRICGCGRIADRSLGSYSDPAYISERSCEWKLLAEDKPRSAFSDVDRITGVPREIRGSRGLQPDSPGGRKPASTSDRAELLKRLTATDDSVVVLCVVLRAAHPRNDKERGFPPASRFRDVNPLKCRRR